MKLTISNLQRRIVIRKEVIIQKVRRILHLQNKKEADLSIVFVNDKIIKKLNKAFLNKNRPTDVLAFDLSNKNQNRKSLNAEIIISAETAEKNSKNYKTSLQYEILLYLTHGILHLCGYDDRYKKDKKLIRKREKYILKKLS
ncbi:MAG: rRNA maturation RNase YbeY [Candidatus Omnitrophota bacterium]